MPRTDITATIRLQFHQGFTFEDALARIPYFAKLGISHIYASPLLTARSSSTHGYDIVDPTQIDAKLGGEAGFRRLVEGLRDAGMGLIMDIVPNHMGIGGAENPWWQHIFEWGQVSPYATWFDIDWHSPDPALHNKVLAPFLGEPYGDVLNKGELKLAYVQDTGQIVVDYFNNRFPVSPFDYPEILRRADNKLLAPLIACLDALDRQQPYPALEKKAAQARHMLQELASVPTGNAALESALAYYNQDNSERRMQLHALLERQHYRLTWWINAADEINWRRFFEVSELAGIRAELDEVFEATHALLFSLYREGLVDGVRLDHIDGLAHPQKYCNKLRQRLQRLSRHRPKHLQHPPYIIAEKILAPGEWLRSDWNLDGTTGYEFMDQVSAVLHDPRGARPLTECWQRYTGDQYDFARHVRSARYQLLSENLVGEFNAAAIAIHRIARAEIRTRDYSLAAIKRALMEILAHFPAYRSYVEDTGPAPIDREMLEQTACQARRTLGLVDKPLVDIILGWLSAELVVADPGSALADLSRRAMTRFQQLMPALCAKSMEDTAFYRFGRLLSRNEVGSNPDIFSLSTEDFHQACIQRRERFPATMLATATHDHKRGEDTRMRIAALSQVPQRWESLLQEWFVMNARFHQNIFPEENLAASYSAPRPQHEIMLYQTLIGAWPYHLQIDDDEGLKAYAERLNRWLIKSIREAKRLSGWMQANEEYENACSDLLFHILDPEHSLPFLQSAYSFVQEISTIGAVNSLSQTILRMTTPGIPDLYQGTEIWDFSLLDPDNRSPVEYEPREQLLATKVALDEKITNWQNGGIKQHFIQQLLQFRRQHAALFNCGDYQPLKVSGARAAHLLAFMRTEGSHALIVVVPRLTAPLMPERQRLLISADAWQDTIVHLPDRLNTEAYNVISGQPYHVYAGQILVRDLFSRLPWATLAVDTKQ
ncbi:malto-oligosyltrehalose synthase [Methylobacillus flagellatus]|uniref:Maltooligosyl trehalose synthase n=1 Tax=Methylobacillus flagellatus (strain ATCC 51484 / DSM 6875 / VKM B-1610 / KT) TaxID=265072 RepID=Q1H1F3_METFK|nr:malto-oligosyltrehalose synthase [Methylobacillus flagellatus]ABE49684.1 maltooligosyl trehalose synthase [Methylobacillus flagellatus KT]